MNTGIRLLGLFLALCLGSCARDSSRTTSTSSATFTSLAEKQAFLERYVTFRRQYDTLEFQIFYRDGADGRTPSPSEWDIRMVATVPADQIDAWIAGCGQVDALVETAWLRDLPGGPVETSGVAWYQDAQKLVGIDRENRMVLYRSQRF